MTINTFDWSWKSFAFQERDLFKCRSLLKKPSTDSGALKKLKMKKRHFFHLGFLCLVLTFSSIFVNAKCNPLHSFSEASCFNGGSEIVIQGLTTTPIEVYFPEYLEGSLVVLTIYDNEGAVLFLETTFEMNLDYSSLNLPEGEKTLTIEVSEAIEVIAFE